MSLWLPYALGAALLASFNPIVVKRLLRERDLPRRLPGALIMLAGAALIGA